MKLSWKQIAQHKVPKKSLSAWWLGQAGFIVKSPGGVTAVIDPYLSNSCGKSAAQMGINCRRRYPPPILPRELVGIDLYVLTHSHQDHLDPETVKPYLKAGGTGPFLAPAQTVQKLIEFGAGPDQITMTWPGKIHGVGDLTFLATFAVPFGGDDLTHVGYLVSAKGGPTFYFTGDTAYEEVLATSVVEHKPDVMFTVINGIYRNLGPTEAARLAGRIKPKVVVPYHYDLFPDSLVPPNLLQMNLRLYDMQDRFRIVTPGKAYIYSELKGA
jgi:L-ascorbate 6-phosphate lactonase